jgi:ribonuclease J
MNNENANNAEQKKPYHNKKQQFNKTKIPFSKNGFHTNVKDAIFVNKKIQERRLRPHKFANSRGSIKITPLGGLEQIGGNMAVIETKDSAIIVDVGMSFPDESMHGVDILVPDFTYIRKIKDKIISLLPLSRRFEQFF